MKTIVRFATWTLHYATWDCVLEIVRPEEDLVAPILAGGLTGLSLRWR